MKNYYDALGVGETASDNEIKSAFRKLAAQHHPDKGGDHKKFVEIKEAYETLSNPQKRQMYDQFGTADPNQRQHQYLLYSSLPGRRLIDQTVVLIVSERG